MGLQEFSIRNCGYSKLECYNDPEKSFYGQLLTAEQYGWDPVPFYLYGFRGPIVLGGEEMPPDSEYRHGITIKSRPVKTEDDISKLTLPDLATVRWIQKLKAFSTLAKNHEIPVYIGSHPPLGMAAEICGFELFFRWLLRKPELCHRVAELALEIYTSVVNDWAATFGTGNLIPVLFLSTESNQLLSGKQFEKFALPYHVKLHERLRAMGIKHTWIHFCGDQNLNMPYFAEFAGWPHPSILSISEQMDIEVFARNFPQDIIHGNIHPVTIQSGTPKQVYEACQAAIEKGKKVPGGFILGPGCELPPATPPVNAFAITKAVNDFGWYE